MAWPTPSLDDMILTEGQNGARWLHALCMAVNERQAAIGIAQTQFQKSSGGTGVQLDLEEIIGLWVGGENDGAITNLNACMTAIKAMMTQTNTYGTFPYWLKEHGLGADSWALSSIQTDVGLGVFADAASSWTDMKFWKQIHGALERMTICRKVSPRGGSSFKERVGYDSAGTEESWDAARADSPSTVSGGTIGWFASGIGGIFDPTPWVITLRNECSASFANACSPLGTIDEAYYVLSAGDATPGPAWKIKTGVSAEETVPAGTAGHFAAPDVALSNSNFTQYRYSAEPSDLPTSPPVVAGGGGYWCQMTVSYVDIYITPYLTDQL